MKILLFDMGSFTCHDIKEELIKQGHVVEGMYYYFSDRYRDEFFEERMALRLNQEKYDAVISVNFFPLIAVACKEKGVPYISWSYDSPLDEKLTDYFGYDTNHIFLFDKLEVHKLRQAGYTNVYHLPLAVNADRIERLELKKRKEYVADISFVGSLYESELDTLLLPADNYIKGYVEGIVQSQLQIYGSYFVEDSINEQLIARLNDCYKKIGQDKIKLTAKGLSYSIAKYITHFERIFLLNEFANDYDTHIYTTDKCELSPKLKKHGPVKYFDEMNYVFANSRLNLCPTLKNIASGIPLRALDVMAAGGALFINFQPEMSEYFTDGEDVVMYEGVEDAFTKAQYYLDNPDELAFIAENGNRKVKELFGYEQRIHELLRVVE